MGYNLVPCDLRHKPPANHVKCNTDAAIFSDLSSVGLAVVVCDSNGNFLAARTSIIEGVPLVKKCEALALEEIITWIAELGF